MGRISVHDPPVCAEEVCAEGRLQLPVEPFDETVGHRVVCGSSNALGAERTEEVGEVGGLELTATVCRDGGGNPEAANPTGNKGLRNSSGSDVGNGNSFRPTSKSVYASEQVTIAVAGGKWTYKVQMNMAEAGVRWKELADWRVRMSMNFRALAR